VTVTLPDPPREAPRPPFPVVAVIAPLVAAVVIGAIIRSPYVLVFAALSPIVAVASALEARRAARRQRRTESRRFADECAQVERAIREAHRAESASAFGVSSIDGGPIIGAAPAPSDVLRASVGGAHPDPEVAARLQMLEERAATNDRMPVPHPRGRVEVRGDGIVADRLRVLCAESAEVAHGHARAGVSTVTVMGFSHLVIDHADGRRVVADAVLPFAADERRGREQQRAAALPEGCMWGELSPSAPDGALAVGIDHSGPFALDLVAEGPHVLVGGATGSGKSEFLRALALSAAARPDIWSVLYVDFKGGATFADLADLPSTTGVITDLDSVLAMRALGSLRAEIERRERVLAQHRVRDIAALASGLTRLLILVDEYAALVSAHPALQSVFADISARGRSLGIHLVLCTQRPGGVIHDTVAVNCAIRALFRTSDTADARALLGADAPRVDRLARGRAYLRMGGDLAEVQIALVAPSDVTRVAGALHASPAAASPWAPPLPPLLDETDDAVVRARGDVRHGTELMLGLVDDVAAQCWSVAVWDPQRDGALAVLGCAGSGRTTALATLAQEGSRAGWRVIRVPETVADAHQVLGELADGEYDRDGRAPLVLSDRFVALIDGAAPEQAAVLLARWDAAAREVHRRGGGMVADLGTATGSARILAGRFGARLQLRALDSDDHRAAGAPAGEYDHRAPAGRGWWRGATLQVLRSAQTLPAPVAPQVAAVTSDSVLAVITPAVDQVRARLDGSARSPVTPVHPLTPLTPVSLGQFAAHLDAGAPASAPIVCIAHPDEWQREWQVLAQARREALMVFDGCDVGDLRTLIGARIDPPPIDRGEVWMIDPGQGSSPRIRRGRWENR
jgi:DNA segregation ATPase FtsK/SpoIIIE, S-DNA-T family